MTPAAPHRGWAEVFYEQQREEIARRTSRLFAWLMAGEWLFAMALALFLTPYSWVGSQRSVHLHVQSAIFLGGAICSLPIFLAIRLPAATVTRWVMASAQMLMCSLFIHLTGGRIETHFGIFGSLAFLAFYRDPWVLLPATLLVAADHLLRGLFWPQSIYGIPSADLSRFFEHAAWVLFEDAFLIISCVQSQREMRAIATQRAQIIESTNEDLEAADREAHEAAARLRSVLDLACSSIVTARESTGEVVDWNRGAEEIFGWTRTEVIGRPLAEVMKARDESHRSLEAVDRLVKASRNQVRVQIDFLRRDGSEFPAEISAGRVATAEGGLISFFCKDLSRDRQLELELRQAQKLESVGRLAAGIAHEINTPIQFIGDSIAFLDEAFGSLQRIRERHFALLAAAGHDERLAPQLAAVREIEESEDFDYLVQQIPLALRRTAEGTSRVATIVRAMKSFAHPDQEHQAAADLNAALENTVTVARNELKYVADVKLELGQLPLVTCHVGELNQVFLNLLVNAAHAIEDKVRGTQGRGEIRVRTSCEGRFVTIRIEDDGAGIPPEARPRIFEPFFTTKEVGKGTGQGLAISRNVVVDKHGGTLTFESEPGSGATFIVRLPVEGAQGRKSAA